VQAQTPRLFSSVFDLDLFLHSSLRQFLIALTASTAISAGGVVAAWMACRMGAEGPLESSALGLFIAGVLVMALIVPALTAAQTRARDQAAALAGALWPWIGFWAWIARSTQTLASEWLGASVILVSFAAMLGGFCALLVALGLSRALVAGMATLLGMMWVTWPIWTTTGITKTGPASPLELLWRHQGGLVVIGLVALLAAIVLLMKYRPRPTIGVLVLMGAAVWLIGPLLDISTPRLESGLVPYETHLSLNPALAINAQVYRQFGSWSEQSVAYHLTELNQSVPYAFPGTLWPTVGWHLGVGVFGLLVARVVGRGNSCSESKL